MTDYLLVHDLGQGGWSWGRVWGYMTAPQEYPPRLYVPRQANRVFPMDLPGHGLGGQDRVHRVSTEDCVNAILEEVKGQRLADLVMVGHGFSAPLVLMAASRLAAAPKRVVLVAGVIPRSGHNMISALPQKTRLAFQLLSTLSQISRKPVRLPESLVVRYLCNSLEPMEVVRVAGSFAPFPAPLLKAPLFLVDSLMGQFPITYVILAADRLLPPRVQRSMQATIPGVASVEVASCHQVMLQRPKELSDILLQCA